MNTALAHSLPLPRVNPLALFPDPPACLPGSSALRREADPALPATQPGVRSVAWHDAGAAIERFRYSIYVTEQGQQLPCADHHRQRLPDPHDATGEHFISEDATGITGYGRLHIGALPPDVVRRFGIGDFLRSTGYTCCWISRLMVASDRRSQWTTARLMRFMYAHARARNAAAGFCHCDPRLAQLYEGFGLYRFGEAFVEPHVGEHVMMVLILDDRDRHEKSRPLFRDVEQMFDANRERAAVVRREFLLRRAWRG